MNSTEVGSKLVDLFNKGDFATIYAELYSPNVISIEADGMESKGMEGIQAKNEWWEANFEVHSMASEGPFPHGDDTFCVIYVLDTTHRESGQRNQSREVGVYKIADGRVVEERFCYSR